jgi:hypothetical protein
MLEIMSLFILGFTVWMSIRFVRHCWSAVSEPTARFDILRVGLWVGLLALCFHTGSGLVFIFGAAFVGALDVYLRQCQEILQRILDEEAQAAAEAERNRLTGSEAANDPTSESESAANDNGENADLASADSEAVGVVADGWAPGQPAPYTLAQVRFASGGKRVRALLGSELAKPAPNQPFRCRVQRTEKGWRITAVLTSHPGSL